MFLSEVNCLLYWFLLLYKGIYPERCSAKLNYAFNLALFEVRKGSGF